MFYPGLKDHPGYDINAGQTSGSGSMISFRVDCADTALRMLQKVKIVTFAESVLGKLVADKGCYFFCVEESSKIGLMWIEIYESFVR